jgi:hypothetical protein
VAGDAAQPSSDPQAATLQDPPFEAIIADVLNANKAALQRPVSHWTASPWHCCTQCVDCFSMLPGSTHLMTACYTHAIPKRDTETKQQLQCFDQKVPQVVERIHTLWHGMAPCAQHCWLVRVGSCCRSRGGWPLTPTPSTCRYVRIAHSPQLAKASVVCIAKQTLQILAHSYTLHANHSPHMPAHSHAAPFPALFPAVGPAVPHRQHGPWYQHSGSSQLGLNRCAAVPGGDLDTHSRGPKDGYAGGVSGTTRLQSGAQTVHGRSVCIVGQGRNM